MQTCVARGRCAFETRTAAISSNAARLAKNSGDVGVPLLSASTKSKGDRSCLSFASGSAPASSRMRTMLLFKYPAAMWSGVYPTLSCTPVVV